jgi:ribosomal protein S3, eukaryotic/archaeal type
MADEQQFIENGLQRTQINEFFADELGRAGYGGMDLAKTPMGTQIVLKAEKPGMVIGKGGKNIRKITQTLETEFGLDDPQVDVQEVDEPDLNAQIVADRLANALERGWYFRNAGHTTIDRIIETGALGAEIVLSGKVTGARSRVEKFNRGYIKHNGEPAEEIVDKGVATAVVQLGTIGVRVKIIPPGAELPDDFQIYEGMEVDDYVDDSDGWTSCWPASRRRRQSRSWRRRWTRRQTPRRLRQPPTATRHRRSRSTRRSSRSRSTARTPTSSTSPRSTRSSRSSTPRSRKSSMRTPKPRPKR